MDLIYDYNEKNVTVETIVKEIVDDKNLPGYTE